MPSNMTQREKDLIVKARAAAQARKERKKRDETIRRLRAKHMTVREIVEQLGGTITHQRVSQILGGAKRGERVKGGGK